MANRLKMAVIETIQSLRGRGWSARRIARELGVDRETVARQLRAPPAGSNAAIAPFGSAEVEPVSNAAIAPSGSPVAEPGSNTAKAPSGSKPAKSARPRSPPPAKP